MPAHSQKALTGYNCIKKNSIYADLRHKTDSYFTMIYAMFKQDSISLDTAKLGANHKIFKDLE